MKTFNIAIVLLILMCVSLFLSIFSIWFLLVFITLGVVFAIKSHKEL